VPGHLRAGVLELQKATTLPFRVPLLRTELFRCVIGEQLQRTVVTLQINKKQNTKHKKTYTDNIFPNVHQQMHWAMTHLQHTMNNSQE